MFDSIKNFVSATATLVMEHKAEAAAIAAAGVAVYKTATVVYSYFATKTAA